MCCGCRYVCSVSQLIHSLVSADLIQLPDPETFEQLIDEPRHQSVGFLNLIYAYAGQAIFIELISDMKRPQDFPKAVIASTAIMYLTYLIVGVIGFHFLGPNVQAPITSQIPETSTTRLSNVFLLVHLIVAYVIEVNILSSAATGFLTSKIEICRDMQPEKLWLIISSGIVLFCVLSSNYIPFLGDLMGLFGAIGSVATTYFFPCLFTLILRHQSLSRIEFGLCVLIVPISVAIAFFGGYSSAQSIRDHLLIK